MATQTHNLSEDELSREEQQALANRRTGLMLFQLSWIMVFVCLIVVNLQLRTGFTSWPPPGVAELGNTLPTVATVLLIASGVTVWRAQRLLKQDAISEFMQLLSVVMVMGAVFVGIMAYEWWRVPSSGQYSAVFRVMTGFHAFHALAIGVFMGMVYLKARAGEYGATSYWSVEAAAKLWYFVVIAWLMFYVVLYWI